MSQESAAKRAGVPRHVWVRYELGTGSIPTEMLPDVVQAVQAEVDEIIYGEKRAA